MPSAGDWLFGLLRGIPGSGTKSFQLPEMMRVARLDRMASLRYLDRLGTVAERELHLGKGVLVRVGRPLLDDTGGQLVRSLEIQSALGREPSGVVGDQGVVWKLLEMGSHRTGV